MDQNDPGRAQVGIVVTGGNPTAITSSQEDSKSEKCLPWDPKMEHSDAHGAPRRLNMMLAIIFVLERVTGSLAGSDAARSRRQTGSLRTSKILWI